MIASDSSDAEYDLNIGEDDKTYDTESKIYVSCVERCEKDLFRRQKKGTSVFNLYHSCPFCDKRLINFAQHVIGKTQENEAEIIEQNQKTQSTGVIQTVWCIKQAHQLESIISHEKCSV